MYMLFRRHLDVHNEITRTTVLPASIWGAETGAARTPVGHQVNYVIKQVMQNRGRHPSVYWLIRVYVLTPQLAVLHLSLLDKNDAPLAPEKKWL